MNSKSPAREHSAARLGEDVKLLGTLLGDVIKELNGSFVFESIEKVRLMSKESREGEDAKFAALEAFLSKLEDKDACAVARGFAHFLNLANIAEQVHRIRRRQDYALQRESVAQRGSIEATLHSLLQKGHDPSAIRDSLSQLQINLVLTAHPTEILRRTLIVKHNAIARLLLALDSDRLSPLEKKDITGELRAQIKSAWLTDDLIRNKPTPVDEARSGLSVIEQTLWDALPQYCRNLDRVCDSLLGGHLEIDQVPFSFGSWMGGDRDGNPFVTPAVTREVCYLSRWMAFEVYERSLKQLSQELSITAANHELRTYATGHREPYRYVIKELLRSIRNLREKDRKRVLRETLEEDSLPSLTPQEFLGRLKIMHKSLCDSGASEIAGGALYDVIKQFACFGYTLAKLDIRQESSRHALALDEITRSIGAGSYLEWSESQRLRFLTKELESTRPLINPRADFSAETRDVLDVFTVIEELGADAFGAYIISMAKAASDILAVELLQKEICGRRILRVTPLFETETDLQSASGTMNDLFSIPAYRNRINNAQEVMIGYSDSAKDAGRLAAAWALYKAQEDLVSLCQSQGVHLTLFHGRGGTVGRGGGPMYLAILSQPPGSINGSLRVTEQGEMIQAKFGIPGIALRNLDLYVGATLSATIEKGPSPDPKWRALMDQLAKTSSSAYRKVVREHPSFIDYFSEATPVTELSRLNIGSRPSRRAGPPTLESLRAIPWIFAWTQTRFMLPVWLGVGHALKEMLESADRENLLQMNSQWPFLNSTLSLIEMVLAKSDLRMAECYERNLLRGKPELTELGNELRQSFRDTVKAVLETLAAPALLESNQVLKRSIQVRNPYVDPINLVQIDLLRRLRDGEGSESLRDGLLITINGISAGMRNTG